MINSKKTAIYSLSANKKLTQDIANILGIEPKQAIINYFADGEIICEIGESVREKDVYVIQSTCTPVTTNLFEILVFVDALKRASAGKINVVIPYFGYARQDRKSKPRQPITSKLVADLLAVAGVDRVISVELHTAQIQGFFSCLIDEINTSTLFSNYFINNIPKDTVIVSPDYGGVNRARRVAEKLDLPLAIVDKRRPRPNVVEIMNLIGEVEGKHCLLIDDIIDTAGSCSEAAKLLRKKGAKSVMIAATHGIFSNPAKERLEENFDKVIVTDSIPLKEELVGNPKIEVLTLAPLISKVIENIESGEALSLVYDTVE